MRLIICVVVCLCCLKGYGQDIVTSNINWNITKTTNNTTGGQTSEIRKIASFTNNKIECSNAAGAITYTFTVTEITGSWTNVAADGNAIYEIQYQGNFGNVNFRRSGGQIIIRILVPATSGNIAFECTADHAEVFVP